MRLNQIAFDVLVAALFLVSGSVFSQGLDVDSVQWECRFCPDLVQSDGWYWFGLGWVSDDAFHFENYSGLEDGGHALIGIDLVRSTAEDFWRVRSDHLGLDSRSILVDGGRPGAWRITARWQEIPHRINNTGQSPFLGIGLSSLDLPPDWETAPRTEGMATLGNSLRPLLVGSERERLDLGLLVHSPGNLTVRADYRRDEKSGVKPIGGGFLFVTTLLPAPIDQVTDQVTLRLGLSGESWGVEGSYQGSFFDNQDPGLEFDNPFGPLVPGADQGRIDLSPDNDYHRLALTGHYQSTPAIRWSGSLAIGRMEQDEPFLPYTSNATPIGPTGLAPLPRNSLNGEVDLLDLKARLDYRFSNRGRLSVDYQFHDRDNESPRNVYTPVTMDLFINDPLSNTPYSYDRQELTLAGRYRFDRLRLAGGIRYSEIDRMSSTPNRSDTDEATIWARLDWPVGNRFDGRVELRHSERDGAHFDPDNPLAEIENPALRKFNHADRDRDYLSAGWLFNSSETLQWGVHLGASEDDYDRSVLGLVNASSRDATVDLTWLPGKAWNTHVYVTREEIESDIAGQEVGSPEPWLAASDDQFDTAGAGVQWTDAGGRGIDLSLDLIYSRARGEYRIDSGNASEPFPDLRTRLLGVRIRADYDLNDRSGLSFDAYYEQYRSDDWTIDGLDPDDVFNLLGFGEDSLNHDVTALGMTYRSRFQ